MKKFDSYRYGVAAGEVITLTVEVHGILANMVQVSESMRSVPDSTPSAWRLEIPQQNPERVYVVFVEASFVDAPAQARVDLKVEGSLAGPEFTIPAISKDSPLKRIEVSFWLE